MTVKAMKEIKEREGAWDFETFKNIKLEVHKAIILCDPTRNRKKKLCFLLEIDAANLSSWLSNKRKIPIHLALRIQELTHNEVKAYDLRPDTEVFKRIIFQFE